MADSSQSPEHWMREYPQDGFLKGYFFVRDVDVAGNMPIRGIWKNRDFLRLKDFSLHLLNPGPGKRILDVGCAEGCTMIYCGLQGAVVEGQDLDPHHVAVANKTLQRFGIKGAAHCGDAKHLRFEDNSFDGAITNDFFEHITDEEKVQILGEMYRVLKPGAPAIIRTPNLRYLKASLWYKRARALTRLQNPFRFVIPHTPGTENPEHIGLTDRRALTRCLLEAGFVNYQFHYAPLRRFGHSPLVETLSTEMPVVRDWLSEDLVCLAYKPITLAHFPD